MVVEHGWTALVPFTNNDALNVPLENNLFFDEHDINIVSDDRAFFAEEDLDLLFDMAS